MKIPLSIEFQRILLEAAVIAALGAVIGLSLNYRLVLDAFSGRPIPVAAPPKEVDGNYPVPVALAEVRALLAEGALAVDARAPELYGAGHLPGAISLPLAAVDEELPGFRRKIPLDREVVTYCNGFGCPDSFDLALRLVQAGYQRVRVFEGGFPQWRDAGLPVEQGP